MKFISFEDWTTMFRYVGQLQGMVDALSWTTTEEGRRKLALKLEELLGFMQGVGGAGGDKAETVTDTATEAPSPPSSDEP